MTEDRRKLDAEKWDAFNSKFDAHVIDELEERRQGINELIGIKTSLTVVHETAKRNASDIEKLDQKHSDTKKELFEKLEIIRNDQIRTSAKLVLLVPIITATITLIIGVVIKSLIK